MSTADTLLSAQGVCNVGSLYSCATSTVSSKGLLAVCSSVHVPDLAVLCYSAAFGTQDVLNLEFRNNWCSLPLAWNVQGLGSYAEYRTAAQQSTVVSIGRTSSTVIAQPALYSESGYSSLCKGAKCVHFTGKAHLTLALIGTAYSKPALKPWAGIATRNPYESEWWDTLDQTPFAGWRPEKVSY